MKTGRIFQINFFVVFSTKCARTSAVFAYLLVAVTRTRIYFPFVLLNLALACSFLVPISETPLLLVLCILVLKQSRWKK